MKQQPNQARNPKPKPNLSTRLRVTLSYIHEKRHRMAMSGKSIEFARQISARIQTEETDR